MKKSLSPVIGIITLLTGCSSTNFTTPKSFTHDNTKYEIGNKENAIKKIIYIKKTTNNTDEKIVFYVDKMPFNKKFNLCDMTTFAQNIAKQNNIEYQKVKDNKCESYFYINENKNFKVPYTIAYSFKFFNKFDYDKKHKLFLPDTNKEEGEGVSYNEGTNLIDKGVSFIDKSSFKRYIIIE